MKFSYVFLLTVAMTFWASVPLAGPSDGLGLFLDFGQLKPVNDSTGETYQTSKILGDQLDYQFALGESFSFSIFGAEYGGKVALPDNTRYKYYKVGILGAELRTWMGPFFFGVHGGQYYLTWIESLSSYTGLNWSGGNGLGLGLESESGWSLGWYLEKSEKIKREDFPDQRVEGYRIILGYRWR